MSERYALTETVGGAIREYRLFDAPPPLLNEAKGVQWVLSPVPAPVPPTPEEIAAQTIVSLTNAVQSLLETTAQTKGYDSIISACSYSGAPNPFQAESQAFTAWRGNVWATCYAIMADVQAGNRAVPTKDELLAELPAWVGGNGISD